VQVLYYISFWLFVAFSIAKVVMHVALDARNGYPIQYGKTRGYVYLLPYGKEVSIRDEKLKRICNSVYKFNMLFLVTTVLTATLRFILKQYGIN
jgi:hypothetical protein